MQLPTFTCQGKRMGKFTGKVAVVTASSDGIGLAIAERLAEDGASVMISSRKQQNVDKAVQTLKDKGLSVSGVVCHVAKKEHRQKLIEKTVNEFGGIDLLVSNAAVNPIFGPILNSTEDAWDKIFEVNVKATFFLIKEVVPYMEKRGSHWTPNLMRKAFSRMKAMLANVVVKGNIYLITNPYCVFGSANECDVRIKGTAPTHFQILGERAFPEKASKKIKVNPWTEEKIAAMHGAFVKNLRCLIVPDKEEFEGRRGGAVVIVSSQGGYTPSEFMGAYAISKTALFGMTKALVPQLSRLNIRVNCIAPGLIKTRFSEALWKNDLSQEFMKTIPLKRFGEPHECSGIVSFLLSDDASYMTGETVVCSGGTSGRL